MKFSEAWLREWVDPPVTTEVLADQLSMAGLEVDGVTPVAGAFRGAVANGDVKAISQVNGVGKKTAEWLLVEMADRLPESSASDASTARPLAQPTSEAESALLALGYRPNEITRMLSSLDAAGMSTEALIREALRQVHAG